MLRRSVFLLALLSAGCGGNVAVSAGEGGAAGSGGTGGTTGPSTCPPAAPAEGAPCQGTVSCSYGTSSCQQAFQCSGGKWSASDIQCLTCPAGTPGSGQACSTEGQVCSYTDPSCSEAGADATCQGGVWQVTYYGTACAPSCPLPPPPDGAPCNACCDDVCQYTPAPGCTPITATCVGGAWSVPTGTCLPPEPCFVHGDPFTCESDFACRWLEPGCNSPMLPFAGCFSKAECVDNVDCMPGEICLKCEINPCWNVPCNACSATTFVCMPPPPP